MVHLDQVETEGNQVKFQLAAVVAAQIQDLEILVLVVLVVQVLKFGESSSQGEVADGLMATAAL